MLDRLLSRGVLVTGGAGFIGSNIVAALSDAGVPVIVCDVLGTDLKWQNLAKHALAGFVHPRDLDAYLAKNPPLSAIVHMGAISATTETDGDLVIESNFNLSQRIWNWCTDRKVPYLYASSAATYGDGEQGFRDENSSTALQTLRPLNLYGWSKHLFDRFVMREVESGRSRPPQWAGLKFFNVYGPNEYHKGSMKSVIAHLYPKVVAGEPAKLFKSAHPEYSDGGQLRDFVYVKDCVSVIMWLLEKQTVSGIFNVGTGVARSFADLAKATMVAAGLPPRIEFVDMPETLKARYQYFTQADLTHLRSVGYSTPATTLEDGVADYVQKFLAVSDPYR
ncbi:ADP-glyceromanno-heptose 6-epimerase [Schlesneria paludicola]|uniref:ADP-glyceromanno-heptose 6-epimerase n=1 Tax=Schlesneria paludicola TaxID=360056 RepID=UPI00029ADD01|nr:ADP-glyceromanno-heptose 6-epimerase [Schlesneria paludicola]